nr:MAG TPA: hypothetical protein [Bacteriophage sp.]
MFKTIDFTAFSFFTSIFLSVKCQQNILSTIFI